MNSQGIVLSHLRPTTEAFSIRIPVRSSPTCVTSRSNCTSHIFLQRSFCDRAGVSSLSAVIPNS